MSTKDRVKAFRKRRQKVNKRFITLYLGKKCLICGETRMKLLRTHERDGLKHPPFIFMDTKQLINVYLKSGRVVRVCERCHRKTHSLMDKGIISWELAQFYIKEFLKTNPPMKKYAHQWAWDKFMETRVRNKQLEFPVEVETEKSKLELEKERLLAEERLHHREIPRYEGSVLGDNWQQVECEDDL